MSEPSHDLAEISKSWPKVKPVPVSEIGTDALRPGDIIVDLRKRSKFSDRPWLYTLVVYERDRRPIALAKGWDYSWHAIYGPGGGRLPGRATRISPERLSRLHRVGNLIEQPFVIDFTEEKNP